MKLKKIMASVISSITLFCFLTTNVFADVNMGNDDGTEFGQGTANNFWGLKGNVGSLYSTEGLRITIYDSEDNSKVAPTFDISGNPNISNIKQIVHFTNNSGELISKTEWLEYIGTTYNALDENSVKKFNTAVTNRYDRTSDYKYECISELAALDIISPNNTANLEKIKAVLGDKLFITDLCNLIDRNITFEDFAKGKYRIAFEPVAYFCYGGINFAMTATECGLWNKYLKNAATSDWFKKNGLVMQLGNLTHSNLPRSAFLEKKDLGIQAYSPSVGDYYFSGSKDYNSDNCIIRCMGVGILSAEPKEDEIKPGGTGTPAEYHTDTDVYTSFFFVNESGTDIIAGGNFSIYDSDGNTPSTYDGPISHCDNDGVYDTNEIGERHMEVDSDTSVKVYIENPKYNEAVDEGKYWGVRPYKYLGSYKDGDFIKGDFEDLSYTVKSSSKTIASGTLSFSCPNREEAMGWFEWHTPKSAQDVTITISSKRDGVYILDENGDKHTSLTIEARVDKVSEKTPPDPTATDKKPSWQNVYDKDAVLESVSQYAPLDGEQKLIWYVWTYDWYQSGWSADKESSFRYWGNNGINKETYYKYYYGVNNDYYPNKSAYENDKISKSRIQNAVILGGGAYKVEYSVSLSAEMKISPSDHCPTATYNNATGEYTMKSGYGIQVEVTTHLSGDTSLCTGSQKANVLFPEFNYNTQESANYNRLLEKDGRIFVFKKNEYSTYNDRVHFTPIWYPDESNYTVYAEVFDVWCPAGQLSVRLVDDKIYIDGNVYDDWHIAPEKP
ncbi:MAG: hypothetical protein ACI4JS_01615 [Oscillospiraceae bacterium]